MTASLLATSFAVTPPWVPDWGPDAWAFLQTAFLAVGVVFTVSQLYLLRKQLQDQHTKDVRTKALELDRGLTELRQVKEALDAAFPPDDFRDPADPRRPVPVPLHAIEEACARSPGLRGQIDTWLNHWETLALTVFAGSTDEDMAFELLAGMMTGYAVRFQHFIRSAQERDGPTYFCYLAALAQRWEQRRRRGRKPRFLPAGSWRGGKPAPAKR